MTLNMSRVWTIVNQTIASDEEGRLYGTLAGAVVGGNYPTRMLVDKINSPDRDVLYVAPERLVFVVPKPAAKLKLRDAFKLARGDISAAADLLSVPREDVRRFVCPGKVPPDVNMLGSSDLTFVQVEILQNGQTVTVDFWVDTVVKPLGGINENVQGWLAGRLL